KRTLDPHGIMNPGKVLLRRRSGGQGASRWYTVAASKSRNIKVDRALRKRGDLRATAQLALVAQIVSSR
ncbi:MAG TPA: hypothetical protein VFI80_01705, partial [Burkholderiales bacterium]|nr:hypothetical protein [Burkholderiales bacterium]